MDLPQYENCGEGPKMRMRALSNSNETQLGFMTKKNSEYTINSEEDVGKISKERKELLDIEKSLIKFQEM